ncbi:MAG: hypothetical protein CMD58_04665 [Gammaproteobacteria bacterium]|nr:hypothetical protein [Gammaproteobacteria bacterium]
MKNLILNLLVFLHIDKLPFIPKQLKFRLKELRNIFSSWNEMPGESHISMIKFDNYWNENRIKTAIDDFKAQYNTNNLRFYAYVMMFAKEIDSYENILDFGAGTGNHSHMMSQKFPKKSFACYDISYHIPRVFEAFSSTMTTSQVSYFNSLNTALKPGQLVYSNLVFSHLSSYQLENYLNIFRENRSDLLVFANTLIDQNETAPKTKRRVNNIGLFDHNYRRFISDAGYSIKWLYQIKDPSLKDKNMTILYATFSD